MPYNSLTSRTDAEDLITVEDQREIMQGAVEQSVVMTMGDRVSNFTSNKKRIKVLDSLPLAYFVDGDTGLKQTTDLSWDKKFFDVEEIAVILPFPEAVLDDADYDIIGEAKPKISEAFGKKFDAAVLHGTDAPTSWPDDLATAAAAAGNSVDLSTQITAGDDLYDVIMGEDGVLSAVELDGFMVDGHVSAIAMKGKYRGLRDTTGQPIFKSSMQGRTDYSLDGADVWFPRNGALDPAAVLQFSGDWNQLKWGVRQDMTYKIFTEGVITDDSGNIVYNLMQQDMIALRAVMRIAWQVPNPTNHINSTATRFPFSILVP